MPFYSLRLSKPRPLPAKNMKLLLVSLFLLSFVTLTAAQSKNNEALIHQIRALRADRSIQITESGGATKIMAVAENFSDRESKAAGIQAMNFAMGIFYAGTELRSAPGDIHLAFWILSRKPQFAAARDFKMMNRGNTVALAATRYSAKQLQGIEYLNFSVTREDLEKMKNAAGAKIMLGTFEFTVTPSQAATIDNLLQVISF